MNKNHDGSDAIKLYHHLEENREKISKASRVKSLLQKKRGLLKDKQSLTDFQEPVLDLHRRDGSIETYEKATTGKFIFTHSTGEERFLTLRPEDQQTRDYADRKVKWYTAHEDYPHSGWNNPIADNKTVTRGYEMSKASDLKLEERLKNLKIKGNMTWLWVIGGIILALALAITIIPQAFWDSLGKEEPVRIAKEVAPTVGATLFSIKRWN